MKNYLFIIFCLLFLNPAFSHTNKVILKRYRNIKLISSTASISDEANINFIIGRYAEILSKRLNYKDTVSIYLTKNHQEDDVRGNFTHKELRDETGEFIHILLITQKREIGKVLNILEFLILNEKNKSLLKKTAKEDRLLEIYNKEYSELVREVLSVRMERSNDFEVLNYENDAITYFTKDDNITFYKKNEDATTTELISVKTLMDFKTLGGNYLLITTESEKVTLVTITSLYDRKTEKTTEKVHTRNLQLTGLPLIYRAYTINFIGQKYISIANFFNDKVYIYSIDKEVLLNDLEDQYTPQ